MRTPLVLLAATVLALGCRRVQPPPSPELAALLADPAPLWIPRRVGSFHLAVYYPPEHAGGGTLYRFVGPDSVLIDVTLAPGPDLDSACALACARAEAVAFQDSWAMVWESDGADYDAKRVALPANATTPWRLAAGVDGTAPGSESPRFAWRVYYVPRTRIEVEARYRDGPLRSPAVHEFLAYVMHAFATPPVPLPEATRESILRALNGEWDYVGSPLLCGPGRHRLTVENDSLLIVRTPRMSGSVSEERYVVLQVGGGLLPGHEHVVRLRKPNERERDAYGNLVAWDLVLQSSDRYAWHRSDWYNDQRSVDVVRCDRGPY